MIKNVFILMLFSILSNICYGQNYQEIDPVILQNAINENRATEVGSLVISYLIDSSGKEIPFAEQNYSVVGNNGVSQKVKIRCTGGCPHIPGEWSRTNSCNDNVCKPSGGKCVAQCYGGCGPSTCVTWTGASGGW